MKRENQLRKDIINKVNKIKNIETLCEIDQYLWDCVPETLKEYIDRNFDSRSSQVKASLAQEIRKVLLDIEHCGGFTIASNKKEPTFWNDLCVEGILIRVWLERRKDLLFNTYVIAKIIYKIYTKEVVLD